MTVSNSSVKGEAGEFQTTRWTLALVFADGPSESVSCALWNPLVGDEGGLKS
jgi:hypothetical protein